MGTIICPDCGTPMSDNASACPGCGCGVDAAKEGYAKALAFLKDRDEMREKQFRAEVNLEWEEEQAKKEESAAKEEKINAKYDKKLKDAQAQYEKDMEEVEKQVEALETEQAKVTEQVSELEVIISNKAKQIEEWQRELSQVGFFGFKRKKELQEAICLEEEAIKQVHATINQTKASFEETKKRPAEAKKELNDKLAKKKKDIENDRKKEFEKLGGSGHKSPEEIYHEKIYKELKDIARGRGEPLYFCPQLRDDLLYILETLKTASDEQFLEFSFWSREFEKSGDFWELLYNMEGRCFEKVNSRLSSETLYRLMSDDEVEDHYKHMEEERQKSEEEFQKSMAEIAVKLEAVLSRSGKKKSASVVGRAVAGGVIAGPAGAIIGAISAADKNRRNED